MLPLTARVIPQARGLACGLVLLLATRVLAADVVAGSAPERQNVLKHRGVDRWLAADCRGPGIKVAILDTGFRGYRDYLGKALPANVRVHSFRSDGNMEARDSQHGILCGEVIHTLAPAAELLLATWEPDCPEQFLAAVRWAREQ